MSAVPSQCRFRGLIRLGHTLGFCLLASTLAAGCTRVDRRLAYFGKSELTDYEPVHLRIENPDVVDVPPDAAAGGMAPRTIADRDRDETWDLTLAEAIRLALENNRVARTRNDFLSQGNSILQNSEGVVSIYDPAIRETGVLFGSRGPESALAQFDPLFQTNMTYGNADTIQNNPITSGGIPAGRTLEQEIGQFSTGITKNFAYGAQAGVSQNWNYTKSNQLFQLFPSVFTGNLQFTYNQPLWAQSGTEYTRIAGPWDRNVQGLSGVNQGVVIARINTDISLADFEQQVRIMIFDVETLYWDLYQAYRNYDALVLARDAALKTWRTVQSKSRSGLVGGGKAEEAQAREQYFEARSRTETARGGPAGRGGDQGIYGLELQLRRICGLPSNDGRVIRPIDDPSLTRVVHDWHSCLATAFSKRTELRKQRWIIKSQELQLRAAKSQANPQLNLVSSYQLNGFGNNLFGPDGPPGTDGAQLQSAYRTQFQADQTSWNVGLQFSAPLGLRNALTQVRNHELRLAKANAVLATQEIEISHELAGTFQAVEFWYQNMETNFNRREAALQNVEAAQNDYDFDRKSLDLLLQAQNRLAIAEVAFYRSVTEYNKAQCELQFRKGTLLEYNNVFLEEGPWAPEAERDALRRAWARSFAFDAPANDSVHQEPEAFALEPESELRIEPWTKVEGEVPLPATVPQNPQERISLPPDPDDLTEGPESPESSETLSLD